MRDKFKNPVIPGLFADPDIIRANGKYYLYPTTDGFTGWSGTQFHAFSSIDLHNWTDEGVIVDVASKQVPWAVGSAWAPAMLHKNGKYYYYFCAKRENGDSCIGVAISDAPDGGFVAMPQPLITPELLKIEGVKMWQTIDPSVYEEDGEVYLLFGNGNGAIVKLGGDLCSIQAGTMKNIEGLHDFRESVIVTKHGGKYHFTWSCDDTGSENYHVNYGIADELYGEVKYQYAILEKKPEDDILGTGHHCIFKDENNTYYIGYHRFGTPTANYPEGKGFHREICISKLTFGADGRMQKVIL
ncbi:MAG: hypothetical protein E7269_08235 [Lachnospiraceae bacterium]|nr:hypothetical protein [Lachnospiraceae bacterium]